ncbi:MAG: fatty acid desaturase, partial [Candidatus Methylomirabilis oxyfera]|nr:fatty acid desaturase [Candidatus Methylomirabilis oxyfera]
ALDLLGFVWVVGALTLILSGVITWTTIGLLYCLAIWTIGLNWIRTLAAHRFMNEGGNMTYEEQVEDSLTIGGHSFLSYLLFPIGLRYHTLHHLFPLMPYHSMGEAHRRLMNGLPEDSVYRKTIVPGLVAVLRDLLRNASLAGKAGRNPMQWWRHAEGARFAQ